MNVAIADILSDIDRLETEEDFTSKFDDTFSRLGYNTFSYVSLDV